MTTKEIRDMRTSYETSVHYGTIKRLCDELSKAQEVVEILQAEREIYRAMGEDEDVETTLRFLDRCLEPVDKEGV